MENISKIESKTFSQLKKNRLWITVFILSVSIGFFYSCKNKDNKSADAEIPSIEVKMPVKADSVVVYNSYPATLGSESKADVVARVNGQLLKKHFEIGSYVKKGQILFTIESTIYASSVNEAKAQLNSALGQLDYATKHLAALEQAYDANAVSEMDVIQARSSLSQAEASVNSARATLTTANTRLGYCTVVAPISGRITSSNLDVGSYISGENSPVTLATIYDENDLSAHFSIPDYEYAAISAQDQGFMNPVYRDIPVYITPSEDNVETAPEYRADLKYEAPSVDPSSGNIVLKAKLKTDSDKLRPGMYGQVMLPTGVVSDAIIVNDASISTDQRGKYLYVVNDSNMVVYTPIEVGQLYQDTLRLVKKGIKPTDRYVSRAMISVRNGEKINPVLKK